MRKLLAVTLMGLASIAMLSSQERDLKPVFGFYGGDTWAAIPFGGIDGIKLVDGVASKVLLYFGGGYWPDGYYRDAAGKERFDPSYAFDGATFHAWGVEGRIGMDIGLVRDDLEPKNSLFSQLYLKSVRRDNLDPTAVIHSSVESDKDGYWENSIFAGLVLDRMRHDERSRTHQGLYSQASIECAPGFAGNTIFGDADWWRANAQTQLFWRPILNEGFALYLGDKIVADVVGGSSIPSHVQRQIGGFYTYTKGTAIRGIDAWRYDSDIKFLNSVDLRMTFPFIPLKEIVPEILVFADQGYVDNCDWFAEGPGSFLSTAGAGIVLDLVIFGIPMDYGWYASYSMTEEHWNFLGLIIMAH